MGGGRHRLITPGFVTCHEADSMLRSLFLAVGVFVLRLGFSLFRVDVFVLMGDGDVEDDYFGLISTDDDERHVIDPPDWAPFSLVAIGGVTCLYAFALPARRRES